MSEDNLKQKTAKGLMWNGIHSLAMKGVQFLLMLFMARLLSPNDYGTIGIISVFLSISSTFIECGFTSALIRKKDRTQTDLSTVFFYNIVVSFICYIVLFIASPLVAEYYKMPILRDVLRVLGLSLLFNSLNIVHATILNYTMNFKLHAFIAVIRTVTCGLIGILLAYKGYGVWALVIQTVLEPLIANILFWKKCKWRPSFVFSIASFKEMFGYSSKILATRLLDSIYGSIYPLVIGKCFSPSVLGHYSRAHHWASFPMSISSSVLQNVTFASLSTIQDDNDRLRSVYRKMIKTSAFVIFPLMLGLSAISEPLIIFTIGEKWGYCANILAVICFTYMITPILTLNINLLQVKGRSDLSLIINIFEKGIAIIILFFSIPYGIITMCMLGILSSVLMLGINTYFTGKQIGFGFMNQVKDVLPSLIIAVIMFVVVYFAQKMFFVPFLQVIIGFFLGSVTYIGIAVILKMDEINDILSILHGMRK